MTDEIFAVYGTSSSARGSVRVRTGNAKPVRLGPGGMVVCVTKKNGYLEWDEEAAEGKTTEHGGCFTILTDNSFKTPYEGRRLLKLLHGFPSGKKVVNSLTDSIYMGIGQRDAEDNNDIIPTQVFLAQPGLTVEIAPRSEYYISTAEHDASTIVEAQQLGPLLSVDFSNATVPRADFILDDKGAYTDPTGKNAQNGVKWSVLPAGGA